jgi:UDP:flavonoid glycosyltransferase YjiC (YdhE family)
MPARVRVLFTTTAGWGHVHPMVPLAHAFLERGDEVVWAASKAVVPALERAGFEALPAGTAFGQSPPPFDPSELMALPDRDRSTYIFRSVFGGALVPPMLADLIPLVRRLQPMLIVHEAAEFAGAIAAAVAEVPSVTHSLGGVMPAEHMAAVGEQVAGLWEQFGLQPPPYAGSYTGLYLDICPPSLQTAAIDHVPLVQPLRPVAFASDGQEALPRWPRELLSRPLVYITFGTSMAARQAPIATVLDAARELPVRLVVTLGPDGDPAQFGEQPPNVHLARYIPQTRLLEGCAAVISHGGSGTLFAALARGIPQLCLPMVADQFRNAEACVHAGAGLALAPEEVGVRAVRTALERLLEDPQPRAGAAQVAREIAEMPGPGEVASVLAKRLRD